MDVLWWQCALFFVMVRALNVTRQVVDGVDAHKPASRQPVMLTVNRRSGLSSGTSANLQSSETTPVEATGVRHLRSRKPFARNVTQQHKNQINAGGNNPFPKQTFLFGSLMRLPDLYLTATMQRWVALVST